MCNKATLAKVVVAVILVVINTVVCVQTAPAAELDGQKSFRRCAHVTGREQLRRETRLKSQVQAYNIVHLFCPFTEYRYLIASAVAGLVFLGAVVFVYFWYFCSYCSEERENDRACAEGYERMEEGLREKPKGTTPRSPQGKPKKPPAQV